MAKCDFCGSTILLGGKRDGELRFCNDRCREHGALIALAKQVPDELVHQRTWAIHQSRCPRCQGEGPVDVHVSHRVWSALLLTSWSSRPQVCCRACGVKGQARDALFSLALGWWGLPFGLFVTPIQIVRNIAAMLHAPDSSQPSERLERIVRVTLASQAIAMQSEQKAA
jgi:hypothetical protein